MTGDFWIAKTPGQFRHVLEQFRIYIEERGDFPIAWQAKKYTGARSMDQNAHFWAICTDMAKHFTSNGSPLTKDEAHDLMCFKFLGTEDRVIGRTEIKNMLRTTSRLTKGEMTTLITQMLDWCSDHGVPTINPRDSEYMRLTESQNV